MRHAMIFAMAVLCAVALTSTAEATWITADGTLEFQSDGFENDTVGTNPSATSVGSWYLYESGGNGEVFGPASTGPGAFEGDNYLSIVKTSGNYRYFHAYADMANTAAVGSTVVAEHGIYFADVAGTTPCLCFAKGNKPADDRVNWLNFSDYEAPAGFLYVKYYHYGGVNAGWNFATIAGGTEQMLVSEEAWHIMRHDLTVGDNLVLTIDGVTSNPMPIEADFAGRSVDGLHFLANSTAARYYVDAVIPEPGSIVMLLSGACLGLLIWRRRSR